MAYDPLDFSDLEGELNELGQIPALAPSKGRAPKEGEAGTWTNPCGKCRGSGRFYGWSGRDVGACRLCKGTGKLTFKTSPETRAKAKAAALNKKAREEAEKAAWREEHKAELTWCAAKAERFDFARSMLEAAARWGQWTDGQLAAVRKCMARDEERKAKIAANVPVEKTALVDISTVPF